jgi:hypothetical protein
MFSIYRLFKPVGAVRFLVGVTATLVLAAPALAQTFLPGDFCTYTQGGWGAVPHGNNPGTILHNNFSTVFGGFVEVGIPGSTGFSMQFLDTMAITGADAITAYLPAGGKPKALQKDYVNPPTTESGVFGGQVLALKLNVLYDHPAGFGALTITNTGTSFDGMMVVDVLDAANQALGGGGLPFGYTLSNLNDLVSLLNQGFDNCLPSGWAQQYLTTGGNNPPPPPPV